MNELKLIKDKYGENMSRLCRNLFNTILDKNPGSLLKILLEHFDESHFLYTDIIGNDLIEKFKNYIYSFAYEDNQSKVSITKTPKELLKSVGYNLYECHSEESIQSFKKYYKPEELICTIYNGDRLRRCFVFWAVKDNVDEIKRENFKNPMRQDEYGTSVISIQFTRDSMHTLSIKNRYNHTVENPDATFSNDLDNIVPGLTESFAETYGLEQTLNNDSFKIPGYVKANDGKYYKYNFETDNIYYCPNNIIIDNFVLKKYPKELYIVLDNFIIDLKNKKITMYDNLNDSFIESVGEINKIKILKNGQNKKDIVITPLMGKNIVIEINEFNQIISYTNENVRQIGNDFLIENKSLEHIELQNVQKIGNSFLFDNRSLTSIKLPNVQEIGDWFLCANKLLSNINFPNVEKIGDRFLCENKSLSSIEFPKLQKIGDYFMYENLSLKNVCFPSIKEIGYCFLYRNESLTAVNLPNIQEIGDCFLYENQLVDILKLPSVQKIGNFFLCSNRALAIFELPNVQEIGNYFLYENRLLATIELPNVNKIGNGFLFENRSLLNIDLPKIESMGYGFLVHNTLLKNKNLIFKKLKK